MDKIITLGLVILAAAVAWSVLSSNILYIG
jgi:hypothetical protein